MPNFAPSIYNEVDSNIVLETCPSCSRKFNKDSLSRHIKVCAKVFQTKAAKFDSSKQRAVSEGPDSLGADQGKNEKW
eukprot:CAMPEP_0168344632 /NCGR_PEP_ID=MMETSP0213-20121227/16952_1 /TAXON_ID=151035 /ORGANISM="Euplotes harpa, Strain FSP1.4" /LENGTH=76 /DNA_ID=CAMNT_0008352451 /DNA_START=1 /DNA_END=228 /DNA_ORIENTATION=-